MALKRFGNILKDTSEKWKNKLTDSMIDDVKDLRAEQAISQMANEKKKAANQREWDDYLRKGKKIDFPEFDAKVEDLPKEDENEKEIKIDRTPPKIATTSIRPPNTQIYDLDALAGNGIPVEEPPEPVEPQAVISSELPRDSNPEWDLEDLAGNGQRETPKVEEEPEVAEPSDEDASIIDELHKDDPIGDVDEEGNLIPPESNENKEEEFNENDVEEPLEETPDLVKKDELENTEKDKTTEPPPENKEGEENEEEEPEEEIEPKEEKPVQTANGNGPINDDTDLVKKGSGVSINDIVDRSQIPHYDYLSFFR